jgi:hypothetical protein
LDFGAVIGFFSMDAHIIYQTCSCMHASTENIFLS